MFVCVFVIFLSRAHLPGDREPTTVVERDGGRGGGRKPRELNKGQIIRCK